MKTRLDLFWEKVDKRGPDECWEWTGSAKANGYGQFKFKAGPKLAHRVSYELHNGPIPKVEGYHGTCVCHTCNNPGCVNPAHLWLGTNADHMADKVKKGRILSGEESPRSRLTADDVENIRANSSNLTFGVARSTVSAAQRYENWAE